MNKVSYVYMLANHPRGALYIGVTHNLQRRIAEHKSLKIRGFSKRYKIMNLVYYEKHESIRSAIAREKQLKRYNKKEKIDLIQASNTEWRDLATPL